MEDQAIDLLTLLAQGTVRSRQSSSRCTLQVADGRVVFGGSVSVRLQAYGGDCAAIESATHPVDLSGHDRLALRARGDGKRYVLRLRTTECFADVGYETDFETRAGEWCDLVLPLSSFQAVTHWQELPGHPPLNPAEVVSIGLAAYWIEGDFRLEIGGLAALANARQASRSRPPEAEAWERWLDTVLYPRALTAAGLPPATTPAEVFAHAVERRTGARIRCYEESAQLRIEDLASVRAATTAASHAASPRGALVSQAIVFLALEAAYELSIAADLVAVTPPGVSPGSDFLDREAAAEARFERWAAMDGPLAASLAEGGLVLDDP